MESHPSFKALSEVLSKYPQTAGSLFQTFNDITLAQQWTDVEVIDLPVISRCAFRGRRPKMDPLLYVVPCSLSESLSVSWFDEAFDKLGKPEQVYLAINTPDSSIVYYKLTPGIVKPPV